MEKILEFLSENFQFLVVKFSIYLNKRVFVVLSQLYLYQIFTIDLNVVKTTRWLFGSYLGSLIQSVKHHRNQHVNQIKLL